MLAKNGNTKRSLAAITIAVLSIVLFVVCMNVCSYSGLSYTAGDSSVDAKSEGGSERSDTTNNNNTSSNDAGSSEVDYSDPAHPTTHDKYGNLMAADEVILTLNKGVNTNEFATTLESLGYTLNNTLVEPDGSNGAIVTIGIPTGVVSVEDALATLEKQDGVDCADANYISAISSEALEAANKTTTDTTTDFQTEVSKAFESKHQDEDGSDENSQSGFTQLAATASTQQQQDDEATPASTSVNDEYADYQWSLDAMNVYNAWDYSKTSWALSVAVIDCGMNVDQEDIKANVLDTFNADTTTDFSVGDNDHGTHVSGIIAARANNSIGIAGVSYNAALVEIDGSYTHSNGYKYVADDSLINAYNYIIQNQSKYKIRVVNMSLTRGGSKNTSLEKVINSAKDKGVISIAASGNDALTLGSYTAWPSDYDACVGVINLTGKNTEKKGYSWWTGDYDVQLHGSPYSRHTTSNYGPEKDISAPGTDIYSTISGSEYGSMSGTSMASPNVAGVAALIFAANPDLTVNQCKDILYSTASDLGTTGRDDTYGWGIVNAYAAAKKAASGGETHAWDTSSVIQEQSCTDDEIVRFTCTYCEETKDVVTATKTGHNYVATVTQKQSCEEPEITTYKCSNCSDTYTEQTKEALGHNYELTKTVEPTCTEDGSKTYTCSNCGGTKTETIASLGGHKYEGVVTKAATCEAKGTTTYTCSVCKDTYTAYDIDALGHDYTSEVTKEPTCTDTGTRTYTCSRTGCGNTYTETIAAKGHSYTSEIVKQATCAEAGSKKYTCLVCDDTYTEVIAATGKHTYTSEVTKEATCGEAGVKTFTCSVCSNTYTETIAATGKHTYEGEVTTAPTCEAKGVKTFTCSVCKDSYTEELAAIGHNWETFVYKEATCTEAGILRTQCSNCKEYTDEEIKAIGHNYKLTTKEPTCTEKGEKLYTCANCGKAVSYPIAAKGHSYTSKVIQKASCVDDEITRYTCSVCGDITEKVTASAKGHSYGTRKVVKYATCVTDGEASYTCSVCGDVKTEVIPATGVHDYKSEVTKKPTCVEVGETTYTCSMCGDSYTEDIDATGKHDYESEVTKEPSCTEAGVKKYTCKVCDKTYEEEIDKIDHKYKETITKQVTCDEDGVRHIECELCDYAYDETIKAKGHNYESTYIEPTCTEAGGNLYKCSKCGKEILYPTAAKGHSYDTSEVVQHVSCVDDEITRYTCSVCGDVTEKTTASATGHSYDSGKVVSEPTCAKTGTMRYTCTGCGDAKDEVIEATGEHDYVGKVTKEPTCVDAGETTYTCFVCGDSYKQADIPATGEHDFTNPQVTKEPTCTDAGETTYTCSVCNETKTEPIEALGHKYETQTKNPTCEQDGYKKSVCTVCGYVESEETISATGHDYVSKVTKEPTCVDKGETTYTCSVCGDSYKQADIPATGEHTYSYEVTKEPSCIETGVKKYTCTVCDHTYEEELAKTDHKYKETITKAATCEEDGTRHIECEVCGDSHDETIKATGHDYERFVIEPTCIKSGELRFTCKNCGKTTSYETTPTGHNYALVESKQATCVADGYEKYKCTNCGDSHSDVTAKATGHNYVLTETSQASCDTDGYNKYTCTNCGDSQSDVTAKATGHNYKVVASKDATCVEDGYKNFRCTKCGDTHSDVTKATGHKFGEPQVTREPGCVDAGERTYTCSVCSATKTEVIEATGHTDNWTVVKEPKLGYTGKEENHCKTCDELLGSRDVDSLATWNRLAGESRYDTAAEIASEYIGDSTCDYVIIASGENFPDALAASYASGMLDAPIILTSSSSLSWQSRNQIQNSGATKAIIIGGEGAISGEVKSQIEDIDNIKEVTRIAGSTRISTAEEIYKQVSNIATGTQTSKIAILASANNYPDALSASPISYVEHSPIFLTGSSSLENSTLEILTSRDFDEVIIAGGTGAISSDIENTLENAGLGVTRLSGTSRYDTCLAIANYALDNNILTTDSIAIASGNNFPDALAGAALCGKTKSILLITDKSDTNCDNSNDVSRKLISNSRLEISNVYLFGGTGAVPTDLENFLRGL